MIYEEKLQNVSVIGAAGKMGSGILLLTAIEVTELQFKPEIKDKKFVINAIDVSPVSLAGLYGYLKVQIKKIAEKKVVQLRNYYKDKPNLIENSEIIDQYVDDVLKLILFSTRVESAYDSTLIFEAIVEDSNIKVKLIQQILENNKNNPWFLTNTSSVPISELDAKANIKGNVIGFHFYNPPAVQKLVELIASKNTNKDLVEFSKAFAHNLGKKVVPSKDFAGFIGNGHYMRDLLFGIQMAEKLTREMSFVESIYAVNRISQEYLIRPMGIFQLMDYIGVDVCQKILQVMSSRLQNADLHSVLIDNLISRSIKGGQNSDGTQKLGIFLYEKGMPVAIYDIKKKDYEHIETFKSSIDSKLGILPSTHKPWKIVIGLTQKDEFLSKYFAELKGQNTIGAKLTCEYCSNSRKIGQNLVKDGIALNEEDVNTVMITGFFHAYGPINNYLG